MEESKKCREILQLMQKNLECSICLELLKNPVSTKCDHQFCKFCIIKFVGTQRYVPCPLCKESVSKRSLQDRPELENIVNKVKDLIGAFNSDSTKETSTKSEISRPRPSSPQQGPASLSKAQTNCKQSQLNGGESAPPKSLLDFSEDCSELDLAPEGDLQKYLSNSLAESASKRKTKRPRNSCLSNPSEEVENLFQMQRKATKNNNEQDLIRYLEEGSCGAVLDNDGKFNEAAATEISKEDQQDINVAFNLEKENEFDLVSKEKRQMKVNDKAFNEAKARAPLSPSKANTKNKSVTIRDSVLYEDEETVGEMDKGGEDAMLNGENNVRSPDSDAVSISSTQQLLKPKPVVSRTYSKVMKSTFFADGGSKNWKRTLPSPQTNSTITDNLHLKGLTTKEKIALKKKGHTKIDPSANSSAHGSVIVTENTKEGKKDSSLSAPSQLRRKSIFKTRAQKQNDSSEDVQKAQVDDNEKVVEKEDPYEFQGSQTPNKKTETQGQATHTKKGLKRKSKLEMLQVKSQSQATEKLKTPKNNILNHSETTNLKCFKGKRRSKSDNTGHNSIAQDLEKDVNDSIDLNCNDAGNLSSISNIDIEFKKKKSDNDSQLPLPKHGNKPTKLQTQNKRKVVFADTLWDNKIVKDGQPQLGKPLKSCLQGNSSSSSNANLKETDSSNEGNENRKGLLEHSFCETHGQKNVIESKIALAHSKLKDGMASLDFDTTSKQNILTEYKMNETQITVKTTGEKLHHEDLGNIYEESQSMMKAPIAKGAVKRKKGERTLTKPYSADKRTLSRRQRNTNNSELLKQQSDAELAKIAHKINEAEDYDFAFCTQEAHNKMEEEQDRHEISEGAFSFDMCSQGQAENLHGKQIIGKKTGQLLSNKTPEASEYNQNQNQLGGNENLQEEEEKGEHHESNVDTADPEMQMDSMVKSTEEAITNKKAHDDCLSVKNKDVATCPNALKKQNQSSTLDSEQASFSKVPKESFMSLKSRCSSFPRPNLSMMVEYFLSSSLANTPKAISATSVDIVLETPILPISVPCKMHLKTNTKQNSIENLTHEEPPSCNYDCENMLRTQITCVTETTLPPSEPDNYKMSLVAKKIEIHDRKHEPLEHLAQFTAHAGLAYVSEVKHQKKSDRTQISDGTAAATSHDTGSDSEDANIINVLARDTECFDNGVQDQGGRDPPETVPDSVLGDREYRFCQTERNAEIVIEETQGTEETCCPVSTAGTFHTQSERKISDSNEVDRSELPFHDETQADPTLETDFTNPVASQLMMIGKVTKECEGNTDSNVCSYSLPIYEAEKNPCVASTSSNVSIVSSSSTGIILPTAPEETLVANRDSVTVANRESGSMSCSRDEKMKNKKSLILSKNDCIPASSQMSDAEINEDDQEDYNDDDDDDVLMVHRSHKKFIPEQLENIEPVLYNNSKNNCNMQKLSVNEDGEGNIEMIGETQALDVLEIDSQDPDSCFGEDSHHEKNKNDSKEQIESIIETELESDGKALNNTEVIGCPDITRPAEGELETLSPLQNLQKHPELGSSIPHHLTETMNKENTDTKEPSEKIQSAADIQNSNSPYKGQIKPLVDESQHENSGNILDRTVSSAPSEGGKKKRTSRGLAVKMVDESNACSLSAGARESIRRSVLETKSKLDSESQPKNKSPSKPSVDVINLDTETEDELIETKSKSHHSNMGSIQIKSSKAFSKALERKSKSSPEELPKQIKHNPSRNNPKLNKMSNSNVHLNETEAIEGHPTADPVMSDLKACFDSTSDSGSDDEDYDGQRIKFSLGPTTKRSTVKRKSNADKNAGAKSSKRSHPSPLASSPVDGGKDAHQHGQFDKSIISGVEETSNESENDEEEGLGATVCGRKRFRQQITSDSDEPDEEQSQSKSSVSSAVSSQAEILSTQQANALEGDVDQLRKEIALYEAKLVAQPNPEQDGADNDDDDKSVSSDEESQAEADADSAALCKRLPDIFVIDESPDTATEKPVLNETDKSEDDLFVSPLSPSPPSRKSKTHCPPAKRIKLNETATQLSENFLKQFQSPGGTVRTKKQLDFIQSTLHSSASCSLNASKTDNLEREERKHEAKERPSSPVLCSQKNKLLQLQGKNAVEADTRTAEKPQRKICFVTSGLTREDSALALALSKDMHLVFSSKFTKDVTHVVMKTESDQSFVCDRTLKFFQGVANKCWVVGVSWLKRSLSAKRLLPEAGFEITGDTSAGEFAGGPRRSRESENPLFANFCFACVGTSQEMSKESLFELVSACGATCVEDPVALMSQSAKYKIIVRCSDSDAEPSDVECDMFNGLYKHMNLVTVMREWILDSLGSYTLQPMEGYVLNTMDVIVPF